MKKIILLWIMILLCPLVLGENLLTKDSEIPCLNCQGVAGAGSVIYVTTADNLTKYVRVGDEFEYELHWLVSGISPAIDSLGNVYLITGNSITKISTGAQETIVSGLNNPLLMDIYNDEIYVTVSTTGNVNSDTVKKYSLTGIPISNVVQTIDDGYISGIRLDTQGNIYLSIYGGDSISDPHISIYSPTGTPLRQLRIGQSDHGMFYVDQYHKIIYANVAWTALRKSSGTGELLNEVSESFNFITSVAGSGNKIYVADEGAEKIFIFNNINDGVYCLDGLSESPELCDDGNLIDNDACSNSCNHEYCGDGIPIPPEQCDDGNSNNNDACSNECTTTPLTSARIPGWHTPDLEWHINAENRLTATTSGNAINIYSDPFEMRINSTYILSVGYMQSSCEVYVDLNDGKCVSRTDWLEDNCFTGPTLSAAGYVEYATPVTSTHASQGFFRNISVRIHVPAGCTATFDDITFKEVSPINPYHDLQPDINLTTACCPKEYCWTGSMCTLSDPWNSSIFPNIWNPLNLTGQIYQHINTSMQYLSRGYRCLVNETGYADWVSAQVKYDWDFRESGYCIRETDCFVGPEYTAADKSNCIQNNQFMNDLYEIDKGNHYCMNGEWTTKTYLIANVLENITEGNSYILFCDVKDRMYNRLENTPKIDGGCTLIEKDDDNERIVTGFYSDNPYEQRNGEYGDYVMYDSIYYYAQMLGYEITPPVADTGACDPVSLQFVRCWNAEIASGIGLYFYYNNVSQYYLMSNKPITQIDNNLLQRIWNSIANFFQRLFGYTPEEPLGLARQTQNYEKLYVLSNNTLKVSAVEEKKYDEELVREMVYLYLNMSGSGMNDQANKFNVDFVNNSVQGVYRTFDESSTSRVLVIKYNNPAELWPYLTAMLRDRP